MYRTGLSSACRRRDTCARLREIARACHAIKFATGEVFFAYAAGLAESGSDWEAGDEKKKVYPFIHLQSFLAYGGVARAKKLPPLLRAAAERFAERSPEAVARIRAYGKIPGLSKVLHYQADSMCAAFCNMLEYGADSLHRRVAVAKHGLDRAEARAAACCLGSDEAERVLSAKEARLKSAGRSAAVAFSSEEEIGAALLSDACSRFDAPRRAKVEAAVAAMAARLPSKASLVAKFRYRAALARELDEALAGDPTCGAARAALFPRTSFKPGFFGATPPSASRARGLCRPRARSYGRRRSAEQAPPSLWPTSSARAASAARASLSWTMLSASSRADADVATSLVPADEAEAPRAVARGFTESCSVGAPAAAARGTETSTPPPTSCTWPSRCRRSVIRTSADATRGRGFKKKHSVYARWRRSNGFPAAGVS